MTSIPPSNNAPRGAADAFTTRESVDPHDGWEDALARSKSGALRSLFSNLCAIIEHHPRYRGRLWLNEMNMTAMMDARPVTDADHLEAREWVSSPSTFEFAASLVDVAKAFERVAAKRPRHPVREYLSSLRWDHVSRLDTLCSRALGNGGELEAKMLRRWFVSAVARAMNPGCKVDTMLVLQGKQGARKSTFFAELGGAWFTDSLDTGNGLDKDAIIAAHGHWVCELAEVDGITRKQDSDHLKALLSRRVDVLRRPYDAKPLTLSRGFVFCGSANSDDFLRDVTGSRRQWVIEVHGTIDTEHVRAERAQLWAEAVAAFRASEQWWFDDQDSERIEHEQRAFAASDSREERVRAWLLSVAGDVTTRRVLVECLGYEDRGIDRKAETAVGLIMRKLGWDTRRVRRGDELVRAYERRDDPSVPTSMAGRNTGWNTIDRGTNAVVPTVPTVPTQSVNSTEDSPPTPPNTHPNSFGTEVGTNRETSQSRSENAAKPVPTYAVPEVGTDPPTLPGDTFEPANDDEPSERITPDVTIIRVAPDGTRRIG